MNKNFLTLFGLGLALIVPSAFGATVPLAPGDGTPIVPSDGSTFTGTLVASMTGNLSGVNPAETASFTEDVYRQTGGTLTFYYQLTNTSTGGDALNTIAFTDFTGFTTSVGYLTGNGGTISPTQSAPGNEASRTNSGYTVNFFYQMTGADGQFPAGSTIDYVEIATDATTYKTTGTVSVIDDGTASFAGSYSPASTPEPLSMGLLGGGLALVGVARWRRSKKA